MMSSKFINGKHRPEAGRRADLEAKFKHPRARPQRRRMARLSCANAVTILNEMSMLQMREFMLDSEVAHYGRAKSFPLATIPARRCSRSRTARYW
jgi:hypothetical protein